VLKSQLGLVQRAARGLMRVCGIGAGHWRCGQLACFMGASRDGFEQNRRFSLFTNLLLVLVVDSNSSRSTLDWSFAHGLAIRGKGGTR
jgi:hypothetical protein